MQAEERICVISEKIKMGKFEVVQFFRTGIGRKKSGTKVSE